jgi:hypothetical protein
MDAVWIAHQANRHRPDLIDSKILILALGNAEQDPPQTPQTAQSPQESSSSGKMVQKTVIPAWSATQN